MTRVGRYGTAALGQNAPSTGGHSRPQPSPGSAGSTQFKTGADVSRVFIDSIGGPESNRWIS